MQEEIIGSRSRIDVILAEDFTELQEIVVIGYGTQKRSAITGAVSVTTADEIDKLPAARLEQVLQGRVSGVQITQSSGSPGNALSVRIRGVGTPNNSDPLYVVDGVWFDAVDFLSPSDIESISVLKDAASAAIYGTNGANGVVLITTKTGTKNKRGQVSYNFYTGTQSLPKKSSVLNAQQYAELILEANEGLFADDNQFSVLNDPSGLGLGTDWQDNGFKADYGTSSKLSEGIYNDEFHVFSIEWDATQIKWLRDDIVFNAIDITSAYLSEFNQPFWFIFNIAVGGSWPGSPNISTVFPQYMLVDYIRVFQSN
jgi:TonB-dependent SusC/RagA subfamily outer membrane receptor